MSLRAGGLNPRALVVLTGIDTVRIEKALKTVHPHKICIFENNEPWNERIKTHINYVREEIEKILKSYPHLTSDWIGISFQDYRDSLIKMYDLLWKLDNEGFEIVVEASGGITPMTLALSKAAELKGETIIYYLAEDYTEDGKPTEVSKDYMKLDSLLSVDFLLPKNPVQMETLRIIKDSGKFGIKHKHIKEKLVSKNLTPGTVTYHLGQLNGKGLIDRHEDKIYYWICTEVGKSIIELLEIKEQYSK